MVLPLSAGEGGVRESLSGKKKRVNVSCGIQHATRRLDIFHRSGVLAFSFVLELPVRLLRGLNLTSRDQPNSEPIDLNANEAFRC